MKHPKPNKKPNTLRTHCRNGHEYTEDNKHYYRKDSLGNVLLDFFSCKKCTTDCGQRIHKELTDELWSAYGDKCACCGETNRAFFSIDHIFNDGGVERNTTGRGKHIYRKLKKLGYPRDRYQILCFNCNLGKMRNRGICPHVSGGDVNGKSN